MRKAPPKDPALLRAIVLLGGQVAVAELLGITQGAVSHWPRCPPKYVVKLETATNKQVKRWELRPDIFESPAARRARESAAAA